MKSFNFGFFKKCINYRKGFQIILMDVKWPKNKVQRFTNPICLLLYKWNLKPNFKPALLFLIVTIGINILIPLVHFYNCNIIYVEPLFR